jgi:hypothetical protein
MTFRHWNTKVFRGQKELKKRIPPAEKTGGIRHSEQK